MFSKVGGRKTVMALIALASGVAIDLTTERGLSQNLLYLLMAIIGMYSAANVATKKVHASPISAPSDNTEVTARLEQAEQYMSGLMNVTEDLQKQVELANQRVGALIKARSREE